MIIEHRTYIMQIGRIKEWLDFYEKHALPLQQKYLGNLVGFFTTEIGTLNAVVSIWTYDNLAHRESSRVKMKQDPGWQKFLTEQPPVVISEVNQIMNPTSFSPLK